jgi:hypothetical protein
MDIRNYFGVKPGGGKPTNGSTGKTNTPRLDKNRQKSSFIILFLFAPSPCPSARHLFSMLTDTYATFKFKCFGSRDIKYLGCVDRHRFFDGEFFKRICELGYGLISYFFLLSCVVD